MSVFDDEKSDGNHPLIDPGHYWRPGNSLGDKAQRFCAYGNYAGVDNRMEIENRSAIEQNRAVNPGYDQYADPQYQMDPRYLPVDPLDGAAMAHDHAYFDKLGFDNPKTGEHARNMFGWDGLNRVRDADRNIADDTLGELNRKPDKYSALTHMKGEGLNGFFGARANGVDAANWAGGRLDDASAGMSDLVGNVGNAHSPTEVAAGVGHGIMDAGHLGGADRSRSRGRHLAGRARLRTAGRVRKVQQPGRLCQCRPRRRRSPRRRPGLIGGDGRRPFGRRAVRPLRSLTSRSRFVTTVFPTSTAFVARRP